MPVILCLHGGGSSAAICRFQSRRLRQQLPTDFEFVFVDAPIPCGPGPGMLPLFANAGPFYTWFDMSPTPNRKAELDSINTKIQQVASSVRRGEIKGVRGNEIVGVMSFSLGAIPAALLLMEVSVGDGHALLPALRFGIFVCSFFPEEASSQASSGTVWPTGSRIKMPCLHVRGGNDPFAATALSVQQNMFDPEQTTSFTFSGGHHFPVSLEDCIKTAEQISALVQAASPS